MLAANDGTYLFVCKSSQTDVLSKLLLHGFGSHRVEFFYVVKLGVGKIASL